MKKVAVAMAILATFCVGTVLGWALSGPSDPCRDLAKISSSVMKINTDIMAATTQFLNADSASDSAGMITASTKLSNAVADLESMKSSYAAASEKCDV